MPKLTRWTERHHGDHERTPAACAKSIEDFLRGSKPMAPVAGHWHIPLPTVIIWLIVPATAGPATPRSVPSRTRTTRTTSAGTR
jgi:hypothetical protein